MDKYYRVRSQEQWEWLKNKLEIEDDLYVSNFPVTILYGDVFCGIYYYKDGGKLGWADSDDNDEEDQQFTESELKEYGLDDDMYEKVEVTDDEQ